MKHRGTIKNKFLYLTESLDKKYITCNIFLSFKENSKTNNTILLLYWPFELFQLGLTSINTCEVSLLKTVWGSDNDRSMYLFGIEFILI